MQAGFEGIEAVGGGVAWSGAELSRAQCCRNAMGLLLFPPQQEEGIDSNDGNSTPPSSLPSYKRIG
jgi:hypothetical protein